MVDLVKLGILRRKLAKAKKDLDVDAEIETKKERDAERRQRSIETGGQTAKKKKRPTASDFDQDKEGADSGGVNARVNQDTRNPR